MRQWDVHSGSGMNAQAHERAKVPIVLWRAFIIYARLVVRLENDNSNAMPLDYYHHDNPNQIDEIMIPFYLFGCFCLGWLGQIQQ